jgi:predicted aspartyl protease
MLCSLKLPAGTIGRDYVLLEMQIGSRGPRVDFMVDTGLTAELITPHLRETLGLPLPNKRLQQSVGAGGSVSLPLVQLEGADKPCL